jgi:hypothetical protein
VNQWAKAIDIAAGEVEPENADVKEEAMAAGIAQHPWSVFQIAELLD